MYSQDIADEIAERIGEGEPLREICRGNGMPNWRTVYLWMEVNANFAALIAAARVRGYDAIAAETIEIADNAKNDWMERHTSEGESAGGQAFNAEHVQRSKLRIETRLKLLAKWDPKRYGEKLDMTLEVTDRASQMQAKREARLAK